MHSVILYYPQVWSLSKAISYFTGSLKSVMVMFYMREKNTFNPKTSCIMTYSLHLLKMASKHDTLKLCYCLALLLSYGSTLTFSLFGCFLSKNWESIRNSLSEMVLSETMQNSVCFYLCMGYEVPCIVFSHDVWAFLPDCFVIGLRLLYCQFAISVNTLSVCCSW